MKDILPDMLDTRNIRSHFDALGLATRLDNDNVLIVNIRPDEDIPFLIVICVLVEHGNRLSFLASTPDHTPAGDLLSLANRHNRLHYIPTAVLRDGKLRFEYSFLIDEEVSSDYLRYDCILHTIKCICASFADLENDEEQS